MPDFLSPSRKRLIQQCKALIKYLEGPGEVDSLVAEASADLLRIQLLMRGAHWRAIEERQAALAVHTRRREARAEIPRRLRECNAEREKAQLAIWLREHPEEVQRLMEGV